MDATRTLLLEADSQNSIKTQALGVDSEDLTSADRADWVNVYDSINLRPGDQLTMSSACIHKIGVDADTVEITGETVPKKSYADNSVVFEYSYYVNHNGINSVALPIANGRWTEAEMAIPTNFGTTNNDNSNPEYGRYYLDAFETIMKDNLSNVCTVNRLAMTDTARYTKLRDDFYPYKEGGLSLSPTEYVRVVKSPGAQASTFMISKEDYEKIVNRGALYVNHDVQSEFFSHPTTFTVALNTTSPFDLLPVNRQVYTVTATNTSLKTLTIGTMIAIGCSNSIPLVPINENASQMLTNLSQHVFAPSFEDPDNIANQFTLDFAATSDNYRTKDGEVIPFASTTTKTAPAAVLPTVWPAMPLLTLKGATTQVIHANGIETQLVDPPMFPMPPWRALLQEVEYTTALYNQICVKYPERWVHGTVLNNSDCAQINPSVAGLPQNVPNYPLLVAQYVNQLGDEMAYRELAYEASEPIFTTIKYTLANIARVKGWLHNNKSFTGGDKEISLNEALTEVRNWETRLDLGRSDDHASDLSTPLKHRDIEDSPYVVCPTVDGISNSMGGCLSDGAGSGTLFGNVFFDPDYLDGLYLNPAQYPNSGYIDILRPEDLGVYTEAIQYAKDANVAFYPYAYMDAAAGDMEMCGFFVSARTNIPLEMSTHNYIGFSPSFYDNHAILPINRDFISDDNAAESGQNYPNQINFMQIGAFDMSMTYTPALSRCSLRNLHTPRTLGICDVAKDPGEIVAKINERVTSDTVSQSFQATMGRHWMRLRSSSASESDDWNMTLNVPALTTPFNISKTNVDVNLGISDSISGVFLENAYFGKQGFQKIKAEDAVLKTILVEASPQNWWGSLLWKLGFHKYEELFPPFSFAGRSKRFNRLTYGDTFDHSIGVKPFTTNSDFSVANIQNTNVLASNRLQLGATPAPPYNVGVVRGEPNYQLSFPSLTAVTVNNVSSAELVASQIIRRAQNPYFKIYSDFGSPSFLTGGNQPVNCMAVALKAYESNDFFYSFQPNYSIFVEQARPLTSIRTTIRDSMGRLANVDESCCVIYKVTRGFQIPLEEPTPPKNSKK